MSPPASDERNKPPMTYRITPHSLRRSARRGQRSAPSLPVASSLWLDSIRPQAEHYNTVFLRLKPGFVPGRQRRKWFKICCLQGSKSHNSKKRGLYEIPQAYRHRTVVFITGFMGARSGCYFHLGRRARSRHPQIRWHGLDVGGQSLWQARYWRDERRFYNHSGRGTRRGERQFS